MSLYEPLIGLCPIQLSTHLYPNIVNRYKYLCHKWPRICSVCHNHNVILYSFMTYHRVWNKNNTTLTTCGTETAYPSGASELTLVFRGVRVPQSLVFCVNFCRSMFVLLSSFSFFHCIVCPSIYGLWWSRRYVQTFLAPLPCWTYMYYYICSDFRKIIKIKEKKE